MPHPVRVHDHKKFPQVVRFVSGEPVVSGRLPSKPSEPNIADVAAAKHMAEINAASESDVLHNRHDGPSLVPDAMKHMLHINK